MNKQNLVWIPFFGVFFTDRNPLIILYEKWVVYQMISSIVFAVICSLFVANLFS